MQTHTQTFLWAQALACALEGNEFLYKASYEGSLIVRLSRVGVQNKQKHCVFELKTLITTTIMKHIWQIKTKHGTVQWMYLWHYEITNYSHYDKLRIYKNQYERSLEFHVNNQYKCLYLNFGYYESSYWGYCLISGSLGKQCVIFQHDFQLRSRNEPFRLLSAPNICTSSQNRVINIFKSDIFTPHGNFLI